MIQKLSGNHSLFSIHRLNGTMISSSFTGFLCILSMDTFTWQSRANASLIHSIHANTFTPFRRMVATKVRKKSRDLRVGGNKSQPSPTSSNVLGSLVCKIWTTLPPFPTPHVTSPAERAFQGRHHFVHDVQQGNCNLVCNFASPPLHPSLVSVKVKR